MTSTRVKNSKRGVKQTNNKSKWETVTWPALPMINAFGKFRYTLHVAELCPSWTYTFPIRKNKERKTKSLRKISCRRYKTSLWFNPLCYGHESDVWIEICGKNSQRDVKQTEKMMLGRHYSPCLVVCFITIKRLPSDLACMLMKGFDTIWKIVTVLYVVEYTVQQNVWFAILKTLIDNCKNFDNR